VEKQIKNLINISSNKNVTTNTFEANSFIKRLNGLMGKKSIESDYCLVLKPCNQIHMFFMKFSIDVVYLDKDSIVCDIDYDLKPWTISKKRKNALSVLEFNSGFVNGKIEINDHLRID